MPTRDDLNRAANCNNPFEPPPVRISEYTAKEVATLQSRLERQLGPEYISTRPGPGGSRVHYLAADKVISLANEVFGFNGWSTEIRQVQIDFVDESQSTGKISLGLSIIVRVTLKDGTYHEDIGYGQIENCKGKGAAFMKAKKEAVTDGLKRALRNFGNVVGNCLYDKDYLQRVTKIKAPPSRWDQNNLHRHPTHREPSPPIPQQPEQPRDETLETQLSKSMSADFEDDFEGNLFEGVDLDSGNPDEVVLGGSTDVSESLTEDRPQPRPQDLASRQNMAGGQPQPLRPAGVSAPPTHRQLMQRPPQLPSVAPTNRRPGPSNALQQVEPGPDQPVRPQQQAQTGPPHLSAAPPHLSGSNMATAPPHIPAERVGFVTGRAAELFKGEDPQQAPLPAKALAFNPHSESPSIRRTNGVDHNKSVPITRMTVAPGATPINGNAAQSPQADQRPQTRSSFVNPQADMGRRIGMPGAAQSPLANRTGYKPPAMQKRSVEGAPRPPLADVSNVQLDGTGDGDPEPGAKRTRLEL